MDAAQCIKCRLFVLAQTRCCSSRIHCCSEGVFLTEDQYQQFSPFQEVARQLIPIIEAKHVDGVHGISHVQRVWKNASTIMRTEGGDAGIVLAAIILHDCVVVEKSSPLRSQASTLAAQEATRILTRLGWDQERIEDVAHAIEAHSYSAKIVPRTLEAKILQDADRLDAMGMVGIARCFYISGRIGSALYDREDPTAMYRGLDDRRFAIDHFYAKLLKLSSGFQTETGVQMAQSRHEKIQWFLQEFLAEI